MLILWKHCGILCNIFTSIVFIVLYCLVLSGYYYFIIIIIHCFYHQEERTQVNAAISRRLQTNRPSLQPFFPILFFFQYYYITSTCQYLTYTHTMPSCCVTWAAVLCCTIQYCYYRILCAATPVLIHTGYCNRILRTRYCSRMMMSAFRCQNYLNIDNVEMMQENSKL